MTTIHLCDEQYAFIEDDKVRFDPKIEPRCTIDPIYYVYRHVRVHRLACTYELMDVPATDDIHRGRGGCSSRRPSHEVRLIQRVPFKG